MLNIMDETKFRRTVRFAPETEMGYNNYERMLENHISTIGGTLDIDLDLGYVPFV